MRINITWENGTLAVIDTVNESVICSSSLMQENLQQRFDFLLDSMEGPAAGDAGIAMLAELERKYPAAKIIIENNSDDGEVVY